MDIWKHGRYLDLWSVVHLLSGVFLALSCYGLGYGFYAAAFVSFIFLLAWEAFEWVMDIIEPSVNVVVDILIGALGFLLGAYWHYHLGNDFHPTFFFACLAALACLSLWGFLDFYFRGYR